MLRRLPLLSALLVVGLTLPACSAGGSEEPLGPAGTVGTAPTTTTTAPEVPNPAVIPDDPADIDEEYLQAVVDALYAVDAQAARIFIETKRVDERAVDIIKSIYVPNEHARQVDTWRQSVQIRPEELLPGTLSNDVQRVIDVVSDCVYLEVLRDYSETTTLDVDPRRIYLGLTPKVEGDDLNGMNPTAWMVFMDGSNRDGSEPGNPCESP